MGDVTQKMLNVSSENKIKISAPEIEFDGNIVSSDPITITSEKDTATVDSSVQLTDGAITI